MVEYLQRTKAKSVNSMLFSCDSYRLETLPFFGQVFAGKLFETAYIYT